MGHVSLKSELFLNDVVCMIIKIKIKKTTTMNNCLLLLSIALSPRMRELCYVRIKNCKEEVSEKETSEKMLFNNIVSIYELYNKNKHTTLCCYPLPQYHSNILILVHRLES